MNELTVLKSKKAVNHTIYSLLACFNEEVVERTGIEPVIPP